MLEKKRNEAELEVMREKERGRMEVKKLKTEIEAWKSRVREILRITGMAITRDEF